MFKGTGMSSRTDSAMSSKYLWNNCLFSSQLDSSCEAFGLNNLYFNVSFFYLISESLSEEDELELLDEPPLDEVLGARFRLRLGALFSPV